MRVKLGPYKVPAEFWQRIQQLPGGNDEQRVVMALDFACSHIEEQVAKRAQVDTRIAQMVDGLAKERNVQNVVQEVVAQQLITGEPGAVVISNEGPARVATREELAAAMETA